MIASFNSELVPVGCFSQLTKMISKMPDRSYIPKKLKKEKKEILNYLGT